MIRNRRISLVVLGFTATCTAMYLAVLLGAPDKSFPPYKGITRITVFYQNGAQTDIVDDVQIANICAFVNSRLHGWDRSSDMFGVPVPSIRADFFARKSFRGHVGAGNGFFECQSNGDFASRPATAGEVAEFTRLIEVKRK